MIKFISYFSSSSFFPFSTFEVAKYLLDNFSNKIIKLEAYNILTNLGLYNDLFYYLLKNESFSYAINYLNESLEITKTINIKKILLDYLNNCKDNYETRELINELIQDDDE